MSPAFFFPSFPFKMKNFPRIKMKVFIGKKQGDESVICSSRLIVSLNLSEKLKSCRLSPDVSDITSRCARDTHIHSLSLSLSLLRILNFRNHKKFFKTDQCINRAKIQLPSLLLKIRLKGIPKSETKKTPVVKMT